MRAVEIALGAVLAALASIEATPAHAQAPAPAAPAPKADPAEAAVRESASTFAKAYNAGDAKALASLFTEDAELRGEDGESIAGRAAIAAHFAEVLEDEKGAKLVIEIDTIRSLAPDVAIEEGHTVLTSATGDVEPGRYEAIHVKKDGKWLQTRVRELPAPDPTPHERLKPLEWLLGDWVDEGPDSVVHSTCKWAEDENFLLRTLDVTVGGKVAMKITQRIGWDPTIKQIKAWVFDSVGGHVEQVWSRDGADRWVIKSSGVMADGRRATATNTLTKTGKDTATWTSADRTAGDEVTDDFDEIHLVRRPPPPK